MNKEAQGEPTAIVKARVIGSRTAKTKDLLQSLTEEKKEKLPGNALPLPYDFTTLYTMFEYSSILRPCVDAYVTNIESFGHHFVPSLDLQEGKTDETDRLISDAIFYERAGFDSLSETIDADAELDDSLEPSDEDVEKRKKQLRRRARLEFVRSRSFFKHCTPGSSFVALRRKSRQDLEVLGNAWWEVARNKMGEIAHFYYTKPFNIRLLPKDEGYTPVSEVERTTDISWRNVTVPRRLRGFIQLQGTKDPTYFKAFGDPRYVSRTSGVAYETLEKMLEEEPEAQPATELIHFRIFSPASDYGIPRWVANGPAILGSRELDEVNLGYFKNNTVPPLALLCSGGRLGTSAATKIEEFVDEHLKGRDGIHRILVLEAQGQKNAVGDSSRSVPRLQFVPLRDVQQTDALFQNYDRQNEAKVARSFRLPRMLRGDESANTKATAWASLRFAEEQVFEPEREEFDDMMNRDLLPKLHIMFWLFRSNAPVTRDPERMTIMVRDLVKVGVLLPREGRELLRDIFNRHFVEISEDWTNQPLPLTLAQLGSKNSGGSDDDDEESSTPHGQHPDQTTPPVRPAASSAGDDARAAPTTTEAVSRRAGTPIKALGGPTDTDTDTD